MLDRALSGAKHGAGTRAGTGAGGQEKKTLPRAVERDGAGKRAGAPDLSGPRRPRNELYVSTPVEQTG